MADTTYRISLEDDVSARAQRVVAAFEGVASATKGVADAIAAGDAANVKIARSLLQQARASLQVEKADLNVAKSALSAAKAVEKLGRAESEAADSANKSAFAFGALGGVVAGLTEKALELGVALAEHLVDGLFEVGKHLFHVADEASRAHLALANMAGSQEAGNAILQDAIGLAKRFGLNLDETIERAQQFAGLGFSRQKISAMFELAGDFRALGRTPEQISRIFADFEHVQASGKLDGRVLRSLAMNGVSVSLVYERIAHNLGLVGTKAEQTAQVLELLKGGNIKAGTALNSIAESLLIRGHKNELGQLGEQAADQTVGGLADKMKTDLEAAIFNATDRATPALVHGMQSIMKGLSGSSTEDFETNLTNALVKFGAFLDEQGPKIPGYVAQLEKLAAALLRIAEAVGKFSAGPGLKAAVSLLDYENASSAPFGEQLAGDKKVLAKVGGALGRAWHSMLDDAGAAEAGLDVGNGIAKGIADSAPTVGNAATDAAQGAIDASKDKLQIHSPSAVMADQGAMLSAGLALGIDEHADTVFSSASALAQGAIDASGGKLTDSGAGREAGAVGASAGLSAMTAIANRPAIHVEAPIHVDGARDPLAVAASVKDMFETELANIFERHLEGVGA